MNFSENQVVKFKIFHETYVLVRLGKFTPKEEGYVFDGYFFRYVDGTSKVGRGGWAPLQLLEPIND